MLGWITFFFIITMILIIDKMKSNKYTYLLICLTIIIFAGFRYNLGYDYDNYIEMYNKIKLKSDTVGGIEYGWQLINFIAILFKSPQIIFLISSIFIYSTILYVIKKEAENWVLTILIFLFAVYYFWESLSIIRQYISMTFFMLSVKYIYKRKFKKYMLLILLGALFHKTILLMLPVYFIGRINYSKVVMFLTIISSSLIAVIFSKFIMMLDFMSNYQIYLNGGVIAEGKENSGLSIVIRVVVLVIVIFFKEKIGYNKDLKKKVYINLYFWGTLFFMTFYSSTAIRRIGYYLMIYEIFVIPMVFFMKIKRNYIIAFIKYNFICCYVIYLMFTFNNLVFMRSVKINNDSQMNAYYQMNFVTRYFDKNVEE